MDVGYLLYRNCVPITDRISVRIPTVGEILEDESGYYSMVSMLTAMPIDMAVELDDLGIDFTKLTAYDLFLLLFPTLCEMNTSLVLGDGALDGLSVWVPTEQDRPVPVILDATGKVVIDMEIHSRIAACLREVHHLKQDIRKPGNEDGLKYFLERERKKRERAKRRGEKSRLGNLIVSMVNNREFKYDFDSVRRLTILQFNESVTQVLHKVDFDNRMLGIYFGSLDAGKLSERDLTWIRS